jgi:hypothetical protein
MSSLRYGFKIIDTLTISAIARYLSVTFSGPCIILFYISENCNSLVDILHLLLHTCRDASGYPMGICGSIV